MARWILVLALAMLAVGARADLLRALAPEALVVVGAAAPAAERRAAETLAAKLREAGGPAENLVLADKVNTDLELAATHHLLVVGTERSNRVMARVPSHWVMNRDDYYATHEAFPAYTPTKGYYAAGYGTFTQGPIGYLEWDRNPYWHYATNLKDTPPLPYRQLGRFTGDSPEGVAAAVTAFLQRKILTGVVAPNNQLPEAMSLWSIDTAHLALPEGAPGWLPTGDLRDGALALTFAGWHLADSMTYAGFTEATGLPARLIWRAKYLTEKGWNYPLNVVIDPAHPMTRSPLFEATLQRRATGNEFFVARLASPAEAQAALQKTEAALTAKKESSHAPWSDVTINGITWRKSRFGVHLAVKDDCLIMESFDSAHDTLALQGVGK